MEKELAWLGASLVTEDEKRRAEALRLGVPFVTLLRSDISLQTLVLIPEPLSRTANIIAYRTSDDGVEVALLDLADLPHIDFLRKEYRVQVRMTDRHSIKQALLLYQKHLKEKFAAMMLGSKEAAGALLKHALHSGAHYVHLEPATAEAAGSIVRYRIEGVLREALRLPQDASRYIVEQLKQLGRLFPVTTAAQEGSFIFNYNNEDVTVALSTVPTAGGEKITMRLTRSNKGVAGFSLQTLGLHGEALELVHNALQTKKGLVLVAGKGKTTLLYSMLDHVAGPHIAAATVEDTVEYRLPRVHQTATRPDLGLTTAAALRAVLKQDPDVVMVHDLEAEGAIELALAAVRRGIFILGGVKNQELQMSSDGLLVSQRLVRKTCPHTKTRPLTREEGTILEGKLHFAKVLAALKAESVVHEHTAWKDILFYTTMRCKECPQAFVGVQEVAALGRARTNEQLTLLEDALFKSVQGQTSIEEVIEMAGE